MIKLTDFKFFANTDGEMYVSVADLKKRLEEEYRVKTNYDRIRNMSIEEMARDNVIFVPNNGNLHYIGFSEEYKMTPREVITDNLKWLNSEVEE